MIPVAGSAYTYSYATIGELLAWTVGWALILEYAIAAAAVSVGWSGYFTGTILHGFLGDTIVARRAGGRVAGTRRRSGRRDQPSGLRHRPAGHRAC